MVIHIWLQIKLTVLEVTALYVHGQLSILFIVLYRKGQEVATAGTTCHWACGTGAMKGAGITPELKALTFPRHEHNLVGTQSAGSGNRPGCYGRSQIQSSCGCPVHTHLGLGGESGAVKRVLVM